MRQFSAIKRVTGTTRNPCNIIVTPAAIFEGESRLILANRLSGHMGSPEELVEAPACHRIPAAVDNDCGFDIIDG